MTKQELASKIWEAANKLRKNIKADEYKNYIIGFMFYKYLSDKEEEFVVSEGGSVDDLDTEDADTIHYFQDNLGYFIRKADLFSSWEELNKTNKLGASTVSTAIERFYGSLNERYQKVFYVYNKTVDMHSGVFDALDSGLSKLGENAGSRDRAVRDIVGLISDIPPKSEEYDVLGYIYEYLIKQFSSEAKKDGAFYTPHELTALMARIIANRLEERENIAIYDPCTGSGGLLLNLYRETSKICGGDNVVCYGQELITETSNLAKMNLFMQDVPVQNIVLRNADTLAEDWPYFDEENEYRPLFVDGVAANPPYSMDWEPEKHESDARYRQYGLAPRGYADLAFLLHCLYHIKPDGIMAIVLPHGVLFRGGSEAEIRKNLIENNNIETIIGFPSNLFFSVGIPVIVMILSKNRKEDDVLFIDASQNYVKGKNQNVLRESDVQRIYDAVIDRKDIPHFARVVSKTEIVENGYNLNIPRYISANTEETPLDIFSVVSGQITDREIDSLGDYWKTFPGLREKIFRSENGYSTVICDDIGMTVYDDSKVKEYLDEVKSKSEDFSDYLFRSLISDKVEYNDLKKKLFREFSGGKLIDVYDIYQRFSDEWNSISEDMSALHKKSDDNSIFSDAMIADTYFSEDENDISALEEKVSEVASEKESFFEELDDETKKAVAKDDDESKLEVKRLKPAIKDGIGDTVALKKLSSLIDAEKKDNKSLRDARKVLNENVTKKRKEITYEEFEHLCYLKWAEPLKESFTEAGTEVVQNLIASLQGIIKRYSNPVSELTEKEKEADKEVISLMDDINGNKAQVNALRMLIEDLL